MTFGESNATKRETTPITYTAGSIPSDDVRYWFGAQGPQELHRTAEKMMTSFSSCFSVSFSTESVSGHGKRFGSTGEKGLVQTES